MKGQIHSIEAVIASVLFLVFIVTILPQIGQETDEAQVVEQELRHTLETLDRTGELRGPIQDQDVELLQNRVSAQVSTQHVEIVLRTVTTTNNDTSFSGSFTDTFQVTNETTTGQQLRLWLREGQAPNVSVNNVFVANTTGPADGTFSTVDLGTVVENGTNTMRIVADGTATVGYSIEVFNQFQTGQPPTERDVFTAPYIVTGSNTSFGPAEVTVLAWQ